MIISGVSTKIYFLIKKLIRVLLSISQSLSSLRDKKKPRLTLDRLRPRGGESLEDADRRDRRRWDRDRDRLFETSLELVI